jgi:hypothetical protein
VTDLVIPVSDVPLLRVPPICARTGRPARKTRAVKMVRAPKWTYAFLALGIVFAILMQQAIGKTTTLDLPISRRASTRMSLGVLGMAFGGCAALFGFVWVLSEPGPLSGVAFVVTSGLTIAAAVMYSRAWVHGKYLDDDNVTISGLDETFANAIRGQLIARREQAARAALAGWHADPSGQHSLRYFDGTAWTAHVHG